MGRRGKTIECKGSLEDCLDGCEFEELKDEMGSWRDNIADSPGLSESDKGQTVSETADTLENAEVSEKASAVLEAIEEATEGKPFKAGCPEHVEGQKCKRCGWKGKVYPDQSIPELVVHDPPKRDDWGKPGEQHYRERWCVAERSEGCCTHSWTVNDPKDAKAKLEAVRAQHAAEVKKITERNDRNRLGRRIPDEPEVEPCEVISDAIDGKEVTWHEFRKYGKQAMNLSRSDRMGNASASLRAGIEFLRDALSDHEDDERVSDVLEKVGELEEAIEECESVEFPGMFG